MTHSTFKTLLHTLFPETCTVCKQFLKTASRLPVCHTCWTTIAPDLIPTHDPYPVLSLFQYELPVIKTLLTAIKFHSNTRIAQEFSKKIIESIYECHTQNPVLHFLTNPKQTPPVFVPIPIHPSRLKQRGFNQVDMLFKPFADTFNIPYVPALKRLKNTQALFGLNPHQRQDMIHDAFICNPHTLTTLKDKRVIIVDDILTTGATIKEAAKTLSESGVKSPRGLTLAKGIQ